MGETHVLRSRFQQMRGVIGRYPDADEQFVFEFGDVGERPVHMVGVTRPLQVEWYVNGEIECLKTLSPWTGRGSARADKVIERRPSNE